MQPNIIDILTDKWYQDCLNHDLPVNPSDVRDIVTELVEMKKDVQIYKKEW